MPEKTSTQYTELIKHPRILIVEDDPQWQLLLANTVRNVSAGASLICVNSVATAKQVLDIDKNFDIILADFMLEGDETGVDLWQSRRGKYKHSAPPFILVTGKSASEVRDRAGIKRRMPTVFSKQTPIDELNTELSRAIEAKLKRKPSKLQVHTGCVLS
jgi:DNA-binding NtrC family response regulator